MILHPTSMLAASATALPWYRTSTVAADNVLEAYRAKGATSEAASRVSQTGSGNDFVSVGNAFPSWSSADGWEFDGTDDNMHLGDVHNDVWVEEDATFSICARIKTADPVGTFFIVTKYYGDSSSRQFILRTYNNKLSFSFYFTTLSTNYCLVYGSTTLQADTVYNIGMTYDGQYDTDNAADRVEFYLDGDDDNAYKGASSGAVGDIRDHETPLAVGAAVNIAETETAYEAEGSIHALALYDRVLTATEVYDISTKMAAL